MKALESEGVADQPTSSGTQVHVLTAYEPYEFDAIPNVGVRHADRHHRLGWGHINGCGRE
jgi:hypothetical protein